MTVNTPDHHSIEFIMQKVREEAERRSGMPVEKVEDRDSPAQSAMAFKPCYEINDFLQFHDKTFIQTAYEHILKRPPDSNGMSHYLTLLESSAITKTEILGRLRFSPEGRKKKVAIRGLLFTSLVYFSFRIPIIGRFIRLAVCIASLPNTFRNIQGLEREAYLLKACMQQQLKNYHQWIADIESSVDDVKSSVADVKSSVDDVESSVFNVKSSVDDVKSSVTKVESSITGIESMLDLFEKTFNEHIELTNNRISTYDQKLQQHTDALNASVTYPAFQETLSTKADLQMVREMKAQLVDHKRHILDQEYHFKQLINACSLPPALDNPDHGTHAEKNMNTALSDPFYVSFEDRFRGEKSDIINRQKVYLPYIETVHADSNDYPILDIGCGRGEWLKLLSENGYRGIGIDLNRLMVEETRQSGLNAEQHDALTYLKSKEKNSLSVVTGFHIIEHLDHLTLITLLDEILQVLIPGGMVIFETPNPENLLVGACFFYSDPTHQKPLVSSTMVHLFDNRGYTDIQIKKLHKYSDYHQIAPDQTGPFFDKWFYSEMDYAIIARKPM